MNPFSAIAGYAAPGGKVAWARIIVMGLILALFLLLLFYIAKPIFEFFGLGGRTGGGTDGKAKPKEIDITPDDVETGLGTTADQPSATTSSPEDFRYLNAYIEDLHGVITDWGATYNGESNCAVFQRINARLDDNELRIVNNNYKRNYGKSLRAALEGMSFTGCEWYWFNGSNDEDYAQILIQRLKDLDYR